MKELIPLALGLLALLVAILAMRRRLGVVRALQATQAENLRVQQAVIAELDRVGALIDDKALGADGLEAGAELSFAQMKLLRPGGELDPLIEDTRNVVREECARRRSA